MRNLKLLSVVNLTSLTSLKDCSFLSIDYDTNFVYGATSSGSVVLFDPSHKKILAGSSVCDEPESRVVGVHHLPDHMALCLATSSGDILLWNANLNTVECVGTIDGGINGMSWSPDMELVAFTTELNKLILMTRDFDPVVETCLTEEGFGEAQPVTVGWGKKETQFHGSEGKKAAIKSNKELNPALSWDDRQPRISWREDGQFFAVTLVHTATGARQIRVWTRAGVLHSSSEDVSGLGQSISYKPSGSLIASTAMSHDKHLVVFFEKNGLRHGEFSLPFNASDIKVLELRWNLDSTVLAVWCEDLPKDGLLNAKSYLQLWTCGNYHWYLKQSLEFSGVADDRVACFTWDTEAAYRLHIVLSNGQYQQYTWSWLTNHSSGRNVNDLASVAVIDGECVLVTPFRLMVVPPPLCAYHLRLPTAVSQVTFGTSSRTNDVIVLTNDNQLTLFAHLDDKDGRVGGVSGSVECQAAGGNGFSVRCPLPRLQATVSLMQLLDNATFTSTISQLTCVAGNGSFVFCWTESSVTVFMHITVDWILGKISSVSRIPVDTSVVAISVSQESGTVAVQMVNGAIFRYDTALGVLYPWTCQQNREVKFPFACPQMAVGTIGKQEVLLGLTDRFRFFVNDIELASDCSSFALHDEFLLLTTHAHTVRCICRKTPIEDLSAIQSSKAHVFDETIRRIERGSRIVSAVSEDTKLILQMPRGNLELIHPRALILSVIRKNLDRLAFGEAFNLAKKHRISMNLLYDHKPSAFIANVEAFVTQLNSAGNINLFLTDLVEEDVTVTMYTFAYGEKKSVVDSSAVASERSVSKLDSVSGILCAALEKIDEERYFLSILTTFVKRSIPDLESALKKIQFIKEKTSMSIGYGDALEYLLYLVDVNKLYDVALGMYDFDLVLMVAEKSQKDPKEYLAYLKGLQQLEPNYRCYSIDLQLKRFSKALTHISKCGEEHFEECLKLVIEHGLYREALTLFPSQSTEYKEVSTAFGEHLSKMKKFQEAAIVFCWAGDSARALDMFEACSDWRSAMCMASQLNYSAKEVNDLSRRMARKLKDSHRHAEAATLLEQYADDFEEAIVTLIAGNQWTEALRLIYKYKRSDFIETDLKPSLVEALSQHRAMMESQRSDFSRHFERLKTVRDMKSAKLETFDFADGMNHPDGDLYSDTSSVAGDSVVSGQSSKAESQKSGYSRTTGRTAKSRQKQDKKKWSLREGSPYEEEALIEVLHKMASQAEKWKEDVSGLLRMLALFQRENEAAELQTDFEQLLRFIEKCIPDIWTSDLTSGTCTQKPVFGPNSTVNSITQDLNDRKSQPATTALRLGSELLNPPTMDKSIDWKMTVLNRNS